MHFGWTLIGSTACASVLGSVTLARGYAYIRIWRLWVRFGHRRADAPIKALPCQQYGNRPTAYQLLGDGRP